MCMWELSTETNRIETAVVRYGVASIFATVEDDEELIDSGMIPNGLVIQNRSNRRQQGFAKDEFDGDYSLSHIWYYIITKQGKIRFHLNHYIH